MAAAKWLAGAGILAGVCALCFLGGRESGKRAAYAAMEPERDTLIVRDTITREMPVEIERRVVDRVLVEVRDTVRERDTLYLQLEREQRVYADSTYRAVVSGVRPRLDSLQIYTAERVVTERVVVPVKTRPRWSLGLQAGYGLTATSGGLQLAPFLGVGLTWDLASW